MSNNNVLVPFITFVAIFFCLKLCKANEDAAKHYLPSITDAKYLSTTVEKASFEPDSVVAETQKRRRDHLEDISKEEQSQLCESLPAKKARATASNKGKRKAEIVQQEDISDAKALTNQEAASPSELALSLSCLETYEEIKQSLQALNLSPPQHSEVELSLAIMQATYQTQALTDAQAFNILHYASQHHLFAAERQAEANLYKAVLRAQRRTKEITDIQAFELLDHASQNQLLSPEKQQEAEFHKAGMRLGKRTEKITDAQAFDIFHHISKNKILRPEIPIYATYYKASMRLNNRTQVISDAAAYCFFKEVSQSQIAPEALRYNSVISLVKLRYQHRTRNITDEEGISLLIPILQDDSTVQSLRLKASELITALLKRNQ